MAHTDIIIQSCDFVNFRVHKLVLSLSSPFFDDMFSLPQPSDQEIVDGLPVVHLSEDAEVLKCLLTMVYPIPSMIPNSYDKILMALSASQKYDMDGVQSRICDSIQGQKMPMPTGAATFRAYAIASIGGLSSEKETLARLTLNFPMTFEYLCDELPFFEGWVLRDLITSRKHCQDNLISSFKLFLSFGNHIFSIWTSCISCKSYMGSSTGFGPSWLTGLFRSVSPNWARRSQTLSRTLPISARSTYPLYRLISPRPIALPVQEYTLQTGRRSGKISRIDWYWPSARWVT